MSVFSLAWDVATGIGPVVGGVLNDQISPRAIWYGGGLIGLLGAMWFVSQALRGKPALEEELQIKDPVL